MAHNIEWFVVQDKITAITVPIPMPLDVDLLVVVPYLLKLISPFLIPIQISHLFVNIILFINIS